MLSSAMRGNGLIFFLLSLLSALLLLSTPYSSGTALASPIFARELSGAPFVRSVGLIDASSITQIKERRGKFDGIAKFFGKFKSKKGKGEENTPVNPPASTSNQGKVDKPAPAPAPAPAPIPAPKKETIPAPNKEKVDPPSPVPGPVDLKGKGKVDPPVHLPNPPTSHTQEPPKILPPQKVPGGDTSKPNPQNQTPDGGSSKPKPQKPKQYPDASELAAIGANADLLEPYIKKGMPQPGMAVYFTGQDKKNMNEIKRWAEGQQLNHVGGVWKIATFTDRKQYKDASDEDFKGFQRSFSQLYARKTSGDQAYFVFPHDQTPKATGIFQSVELEEIIKGGKVNKVIWIDQNRLNDPSYNWRTESRTYWNLGEPKPAAA